MKDDDEGCCEGGGDGGDGGESSDVQFPGFIDMLMLCLIFIWYFKSRL